MVLLLLNLAILQIFLKGESRMRRNNINYFIMTDKYHLLREKESYLGYQIKRLSIYLKYILTKGDK